MQNSTTTNVTKNSLLVYLAELINTVQQNDTVIIKYNVNTRIDHYACGKEPKNIKDLVINITIVTSSEVVED